MVDLRIHFIRNFYQSHSNQLHFSSPIQTSYFYRILSLDSEEMFRVPSNFVGAAANDRCAQHSVFLTSNERYVPNPGPVQALNVVKIK